MTSERVRTTRAPEFKYDEFRAALQIDKNALDDMSQGQADLFEKVSEQLTYAISRRDAAKDEIEDLKVDLKRIESQADQDIRAEAAAAAEKDTKVKITDKAVEAQVQLDPDVQKAQDALRDARRKLIGLNEEVGLLFGLKQSFEQRRDMLELISKLYLSNYYDRKQGSSMRSADQATRTRIAEATRAAIAEGRPERRQRERPTE